MITKINDKAPNGTNQDMIMLSGDADTVDIPVLAYEPSEHGIFSVWIRLQPNIGESMNSGRTAIIYLHMGSALKGVSVGLQWKRFTLEIENPTGNTISLVRTTNTAFILCNAQLELSQKVSDWKPAPEDMFKAVDNVNENVTTEIGRIESNVNRFSDDIEDGTSFRSTFFQYFTLDTNNGIEMRALTDTGEKSHWYAQMRSDGFYIFNDSYVTPTGRFYRDRFEPSSMQMGRVKARPSANGGWIFSAE